MVHILRCLPPICLVAFIASGCASNYSPNTYASNAVQLANKVETGSVVGYREVKISSNGTIGAVTGGAVGGVLGAQYADSALAAAGASAVGLVVGNALDHAVGDTTGWEYIVRKPNGEMVSVTQREKKPLELGQKVLVIMGPQARVVPDYSSIPETPPAPQPTKAKAEEKPQSPVKVEVVLSLAPGVAAQLPAGQSIVAQSSSSDPNIQPDIQAVSADTATEASPIKLISNLPAQLLGERGAAPVEDTPSPAP
jgi:outer membrane lipoprotein SlyB